MARTMMLYQTSQFEHREIASKFYSYTSLSAEYDIAAKLTEACAGKCFIVILDNDGTPVRSIDFEVEV